MVAITTPLVTDSGINDVYIAEDRYAIVATNSGIDVVDLFTQEVISSGILFPPPLSVVADTVTVNGQIYVGTSGAGVYSTNYQSAIIPFSDFTGSLVPRFSTTSSPAISGDLIRDLDVLPRDLLISTSGGVDYIRNETVSSSRTLAGFGSSGCHLTTTGGGYWLNDGGGVEVNYDLITTTGTGIITVGFEYRASGLSDPELPAEPASDIAISEFGSTVLSFTTPSGVLVVEENPGNEAASSRKTLAPDAFISVDFSDDAQFTSGFLYTSTVDTLRVFDLANDTVSGTHTFFSGNRGQELLDDVIIVVRTTDIA